MKIIYLSITLLIVINFSWSQNNQFVYYQDDKFKLGCDDFFPVVMNYPVQLCKKFNINEFYFINDPSSCTHYVSSECSSFSCGKTKAERQAMMVGDLKKISELGFNTIRLCIGSPNLCDIGATPFMCISNYFGETAEENHCLNHYTNIGSNIALNQLNFYLIFDALDDFIKNVMQEAGVDLKIIFLTNGIDKLDNECALYLKALANRFKYEPSIFAYDLYNEPDWKISGTKQNWYNKVNKWYTAIRSVAPAQFVTVGNYEVVNCAADPGATPVDFLSLHVYSLLDFEDGYNFDLAKQRYERIIYYFANTNTKPWIIGEAGMPSIDWPPAYNVPQPNSAATEQQQLDFAVFSADKAMSCGAKGYSWWSFWDVKHTGYYFEPNANNIDHRNNHFGIYYRNDNLWNTNLDINNFDWSNYVYDNILAKKIVRNNNNPFQNIQQTAYTNQQSCLKPYNEDFDIYYDPYNFSQYNRFVDGYVYLNGSPIKNAMVNGWRWEITGTNELGKPIFDEIPYSTYTNDAGYYKLYFSNRASACFPTAVNFDFKKFRGLSISAYGKSWHYNFSCYDENSQYANVILTDENFDPLSTNPTYYDYVVKNGTYEEFDNNISFTGNLIIESSATLTIKESAYFSKNKRLIIQPGGKLIVDGGKLTSSCSFWQGIEVWGTKTASQRPLYNNPNQGIVELKNGAVIENAIVAIRNHKKDDFSSTGGVIICEDAIFRNNKTAVEFAAYRNFNPNNPTQKIPDFSRFKNTKFIVDDEYLGGEDFTAHVRMWDVHGINFSGCEFENNISAPSFYNYPNNFKGIHSIDASYSINGICNLISVGLCADENYTPSTFKGFNYAIMATSSSTNSEKINVFRTNFEKNRVGMYASGLHNLSFNKNKIQIGTAQDEHLQGFGIYASGSTGYRIEENEISKLYNLDKTWGISIVNSGTANNTVYKNTMNDLSIGLYAYGTNKGSQLNSTNGLRFLCNKNFNLTSNEYDLFVLSRSFFGGISLHQIGANSTSAGNEFSQNSQNTNNSHINNFAQPFYYFYSGVAQPSNVYYPEYNNGIQKVILLNTTQENQCLSNYQAFSIAESNRLSPQQVQQLNLAYNSTEYDYVNTIFVLNQMVDGGNTPALLYEIQASWSSDAWAMRDELISYSPYLSQEALIEAALTGVLPDAMLLDICIQNPRATMGDEFIYIVGNEIPNPLPKYMIDLIVSNWETEDARFLLEKSIADKSLTMSTISDLLISDLMSDTISRENEILNWLYRRANFSDYLMIVDRHMHNNDNSSAASILSTIQDQFVLNEEQANLIEDYFWFVNFREDLKSENRNFNELTSTEIDLLRQKTEETDNKIREFSKNILCYFYDICTEIELPLDVEPRRKKDNNLTSRQALKLTHLKVYPNPANDYVNFEWKLNSAKQREIRISTVTGVIIQRHTIKSEEGQWLWDSRYIKEGTYIYELLEENKRIDSGKLTVVK